MKRVTFLLKQHITVPQILFSPKKCFFMKSIAVLLNQIIASNVCHVITLSDLEQ